MRRLLFVLVLVLAAPALFAAGWRKAYFGATPQGSWARYADTAPDMKMTTTITRLPDDDGSARVELLVEFANNQYPPVHNRYTLRQGYPVDRQLIDYMTGITGGAVVSGDAEPALLDDATIAAIIDGSRNYEPSATFKGTETVDGKQADRYGYTLHLPGTPPSTETGDLWLAPSVPFGVVKMSSVTRDEKGKVTTSYERTLVASGASSAAAAAAPMRSVKAAPVQKSPQTLQEAYDAGLVAITVTIAANARNGERAHLVIQKKDDQPMTLIVPKGKTKLHVDVPLDDFVFEIASAKTFELGGEKSAELDVKQLGERRATAGEFNLSMYEGTPLFSGSATVDWVKKK